MNSGETVRVSPAPAQEACTNSCSSGGLVAAWAVWGPAVWEMHSPPHTRQSWVLLEPGGLLPGSRVDVHLPARAKVHVRVCEHTKLSGSWPPSRAGGL